MMRKVFKSRSGNLLLLLLLLNIGASFVVGAHYSSRERMFVYQFVSILGTIAWVGILLLQSSFLSRRQALILAALVLLALVSSLLFHDDYYGGECFFNSHLGYPFSWRDSGVTCDFAIQNRLSAHTLFFQYPREMHWRTDLPGLIGDGLFWLNAGLVGLFLWTWLGRVIKPHRYETEPGPLK